MYQQVMKRMHKQDGSSEMAKINFEGTVSNSNVWNVKHRIGWNNCIIGTSVIDHMSCNESMFKSLTKMDISVLVDLLDGTTKEVTKIGEVTLNGFITLHEVFFVIPGNLIIILIDNPPIRARLGHN